MTALEVSLLCHMLACLLAVSLLWFLRSLSCQRITLHKNLFLSFVLNSIITIVWLTTVVKKQGHTYNDSVSAASSLA